MRNHLFLYYFLILGLTGCSSLIAVGMVGGTAFGTSETVRDKVTGAYRGVKRGTMRLFGNPGPCDRPFVLDSSASVSLIMLPYTSSVDNSGTISDVAKKIPVLLQLDNQLSPNIKSPYQSIRLAGDDCDTEQILKQLLGVEPGAKTTLKKHDGVVILSGRFFQEEDRIYVQTFIQIARRGVDHEEISLSLNPETSPMKAKLPMQSFLFPRRLIEEGKLQEIDHVFAESIQVWDKPNKDKGREVFSLAHAPHKPVAYEIVDSQENWVKITQEGSGQGWISAPRKRLRGLMPEVYYLDVVIQYLQTRIALERMPSPGELEKLLNNIPLMDVLLEHLSIRSDLEQSERRWSQGELENVLNDIGRIIGQYEDIENSIRNKNVGGPVAVVPVSVGWAMHGMLGYLALDSEMPERESELQESVLQSFQCGETSGRKITLQESVLKSFQCTANKLEYNGDAQSLEAVAGMKLLLSGYPDGPGLIQILENLKLAIVLAPEDRDILINLSSFYSYLLNTRSISETKELRISTAELKRTIKTIDDILEEEKGL